MLISIRSRACHQGGFSLIELMVALVAGLIVIGAVLSFTVATVRANSETVTSTRLTQDLRTALNLMTREIRRTGYDRGAEMTIATNSPGLRYTDVNVNTARDCIVLSYNRPGINGTLNIVQTGERKGFRRVVRNGVGVLEANASLTSVAESACTQTAGWASLTDPAQVDIRVLEFALVERCVFADPDGVPPCQPNSSQISAVVRNVGVTLEGRLVRDASVDRRVTDSVRIRADDIAFPLGAL